MTKKHKFPTVRSEERHPILSRLLAEGSVFIEGSNYTGRSGVPSIMAPDGLIGLGIVGDEDATEEYLRRFPNPNQW
jgi:hypothetical protein